MSQGAALRRTVNGASVTFTIDAQVGRLLVQTPDSLLPVILETLEQTTGQGETLACAAPTKVLQVPPATSEELASRPCVRISGYWHDSLIEGPGRRSVAKLQGCSVRCEGCIAADGWDPAGGVVVAVDRLAGALLDPAYERDGVTILGGEPTDQPLGLLALVRALRARGCQHLLLYSGRTYATLQRMSNHQFAIGAVLDEIDVLIDGPYVAALAAESGPWTGSANQRVIDLPAIRSDRRDDQPAVTQALVRHCGPPRE